MINERKCAIVGCGFVGATIAYTLLQSGMFSEMVLIGNAAMSKPGEKLAWNAARGTFA